MTSRQGLRCEVVDSLLPIHPLFRRRTSKQLIIKEILVEAAGVEPASENVTGQENYMLSRVHAPGITLRRSRPALRTDKKRVPLACGLSLSSQT